MRNERMFEAEKRIGERSVANYLQQMALDARKRWAGAGVFEEVAHADLPDDGTLTFFATVDAVTLTGPVKAGQFFTVGAGDAEAFQLSRTFLPASREALRRLSAFRDQLLEAGQESQAALIDLRPVRPLGSQAPTPKRSEPRVADTE